MQHLTEKEIREKFLLTFDKRFTQIARYADKGNDKAYGHGLAQLQIDIENWVISLRSQELQGLKEKVEKLKRYTTDPFEGYKEIRIEEINQGMPATADLKAGYNQAVLDVLAILQAIMSKE